MSRKHGVDKSAWARPRFYALSGGYGPLKASSATFSGAVVVLDDGSERAERDGLASAAAHAAAARALCLGDGEAPAAPAVVVLDLSALRRGVDAAAAAPPAADGEPGVDAAAPPAPPADGEPRRRAKKKKRGGEGRGRRGWAAALEAEAADARALGRDVGRPLAKALERLTMRAAGGVAVVARGRLAGAALKLACCRDDAHGVADRIDRVVLVAPELPASLVNGLLRGVSPAAGAARVDVAFADAAARDRRAAMLRAAFPAGADALAGDGAGDAVLAAFAAGDADGAAAAAALEFADSRGRALSCAEVTADLDKDTKQPELRATTINAAAILAAARGEPAAAAAPAGDADDGGEARVAALVVRGSRCILARSLGDRPGWDGLRLPSAPAADGEDAVAGARRAIALRLAIDVEDQAGELDPLPRLPRLALHRATGGATEVVFFEALAAPTYPLEDYDLSDDEDDYDWYTLPRALGRVDGPTAALLRTAAFALDAARAAGLVDGAHGGVFGQELVAAAAGAPPPGSPEAAAAAVAALADVLGPEETALLHEVLAHRSGLGAGGDGAPRARVVSADDAAGSDDAEDAAVDEPEKAPEHPGKRADDAEADARRVVA